MSEDRVPGGHLSRTELGELAELFDRFEFALDPHSTVAREAESKFDDRARALFDERIKPVHPHVTFIVFQLRLKTLCRAYLKKNAP